VRRLTTAIVRLRVGAQATTRRLAYAADRVVTGSGRHARLNRPAWLAMAGALTFLAYSAVLLWPFEWRLAGYVENSAEPLPEGGIRFAEPGIARTPARPEWVAAAMRARELEVQLEVRSLAGSRPGRLASRPCRWTRAAATSRSASKATT
jgi:hypothetical protein